MNMYFGTRERMTWVKAPAPGAGSASDSYSDRINYLNGGVGTRNSTNAHLEYDFSWGSLTRDQVAAIEDYAYGLYGNGLVYPVDLYAMDRNVFNMAWAAPKITAEDGVPFIEGKRPDLVQMGDMSLNYPYHAALYTYTTTDVPRKFHVPLPAGYTAWVGAHGAPQTRGLLIQPLLNGIDSGAVVPVSVQTVSDPNRFSVSVSASGAVNGLDIYLDTRVAGSTTLCGLMLQILPTGTVPQQGGFISGRGNSGCVFDGKPNRSTFSLNGDTESVGLTVKLIEVGDWI